MNKELLKKLLVLGALSLLSACEQAKQNSSKTNVADKPAVVEASGELSSSETAIVGPPVVKGQWQYKITFLSNEGAHVKKGQPVVGFDASQLNQKLSVKKSELKTARKNLENTQLTNESQLEKLKLDLAEQKMSQEKALRKFEQSKGLESSIETKKLNIELKKSKNEVSRLKKTLAKSIETNKTKLAIAEGKVERLKVEVKELEVGIGKMRVAAPKDGIVIYKSDYQGKKVSRGDNVWVGRQVVELPSLDKMVVKAQILEADAGKVHQGMKVEVVLDAIPERIFKGEVKELGKVFRRKSREQPTIIFDAEIELLEVDSEIMRPGMAARIKMFTADSSSRELSNQLAAGK